MLILVALLAPHAASADGATAVVHQLIDTGYRYANIGKHSSAAPPTPQPGDIPPGSTLFSLELGDGYWDVIIQDDATLSEVQCSGEETLGRMFLSALRAEECVVDSILLLSAVPLRIGMLFRSSKLVCVSATGIVVSLCPLNTVNWE